MLVSDSTNESDHEPKRLWTPSVLLATSNVHNTMQKIRSSALETTLGQRLLRLLSHITFGMQQFHRPRKSNISGNTTIFRYETGALICAMS
jgi:hypothetical protein